MTYCWRSLIFHSLTKQIFPTAFCALTNAFVSFENTFRSGSFVLARYHYRMRASRCSEQLMADDQTIVFKATNLNKTLLGGFVLSKRIGKGNNSIWGVK